MDKNDFKESHQIIEGSLKEPQSYRESCMFFNGLKTKVYENREDDWVTGSSSYILANIKDYYRDLDPTKFKEELAGDHLFYLVKEEVKYSPYRIISFLWKPVLENAVLNPLFVYRVWSLRWPLKYLKVRGKGEG